MANLNKVFLMGNLTRDPELRYTPSGTAVCEFGMAINRSWTGKDGQKRDDTCFVDCQAWARGGELIAEYCKKGRPLFVEGRLNFSSWEGKDGQKRSKLRVTVDNFQFLGSGRRDNAGPDSAGAQPADAPPPRQNPAPAPTPAPAPAPEAAPDSEGQYQVDDDVPF